MDLRPFQKIQSPLFVFLSLQILGFFAYRNCFGIDIPTDSYTLMFSFQKYGVAGILHNFYDIGMAPVADSFMFILYKLFGTNSTCWIVCSIFMHACNAFLGFTLGQSLLKTFEVRDPWLPSFLASILFLLSPFQTEVVLWAPRMFNYQIAAAGFMGAFYFLNNYFTGTEKKHLYLSFLCYTLAIFAFESALIFPGISVCLFLAHRIAFGNKLPLKTFIISIFLPFTLIFIGYFCTCKLWRGDWIMHYGASTHLYFTIPLIIGNYVRYFTKFFLYWRYLPTSRGEWLQNMHIDIKNPMIAVLLLVITLFIFCFIFYRLYKKEAKLVLLCALLFFAFLVSLIPVINLDTSFVGVVMSDRYGYLPAVSFYMLLTVLFYLLFAKAGKIIAAGLVCLSFLFLSQTIPLWTESNDYCKKLIKNTLPLADTKETIYVLNLPDNYNWILLFRNAFGEYFSLKYGKDLRDKVIPVAATFISSQQDSVRIEQKSENEFLISSTDGVQRFLHDGIWGRSYETPAYSVEFNDEHSAYLLKIKESAIQSRWMYIAGSEWREFTPQSLKK